MCQLIYDNTKNADLYYIIKQNIADKFIYLAVGDKQFVFLDQRELRAFLETNQNPNIVSVALEPIINQALKVAPGENQLQKVLYFLIEKYAGLKQTIQVPISFPLDLADFLRSKKINLKIVEPFFKTRENKSPKEVEEIKKALAATYPAYKYLEKVFQESTIADGILVYNNQVLTSEYLKKEVEKIFLDNGLLSAEGIIISSGLQTSMPHHAGSGPILANVPIICDLFPRSIVSGYFADITRTYFKSQPPEKVLQIYNAVFQAQQAVKKIIKPGIKAGEVYQATLDCFKELGFESNEEKGFIHGTGHGLGLEIHEAPYLRASHNEVLEVGNVITIEPGLYYPELGGVRIEDVILVTENGYQDLTDYPKELKIFD